MRKTVLLIVLALWASTASAQVAIDDVSRIAQAIHDAEGVNIGAGSTREYRNDFWARVVGAVHWGLPPYNGTPDPSWCLKDGGGGRPQSDDVIVKCATREFWDCIPGAGANGYRFSCSKDPHPLPGNQNVYAPPRPAGATGGNAGGTGSLPPPVITVTPISLQPVLDALAALGVKVDAAVSAAQAATRAADEARTQAEQAKINASDLRHIAVPELKALLEKTGVTGCLKGKVPKAFGGSTEVLFCPPGPQ